MRSHILTYLLIVSLSCVPLREQSLQRHYKIEGIRLGLKGGYVVWLRNLDNLHYRYYRELPDSFRVGRVVVLPVVSKRK